MGRPGHRGGEQRQGGHQQGRGQMPPSARLLAGGDLLQQCHVREAQHPPAPASLNQQVGGDGGADDHEVAEQPRGCEARK